MKNQKKYVSTLPLSLRGKKRYILFSIHPFEKLDKSSVEKSFFHHLLHSFGTLGMPLLRYKFISYNPSNGLGIIRVSHTKVSRVLVSLTLIDSLHALPVAIRSRRVSGSLKSLRPVFQQKA
jgi:RNase P/RNase MRP subunit POP5